MSSISDGKRTDLTPYLNDWNHPMYFPKPARASRPLIGTLLSLLILLSGSFTAYAQVATPAYIQLGEGERLADEQVLRLGVNRNLVGGAENTWYVHASLQVWEPLLTYDDEFRLQPKLAKSWELSPDGLTWTFNLRDDVTFSDGTPFNADVALFNIERYKAVSLRPSIFLGGINYEEIYGNPTAITKIDDYTFSISYAEPRPLLPYAIANHYSAIQGTREDFDENYNWIGTPKGTGPFKLVDWQRDQYATIERNDAYWGDVKPTLTRVEVKIYPDSNARVSALKGGEVDALAELAAVLPAQASELAGDDNYWVADYVSACNNYIGFNGATGIFSDVRLRQAVSLSIDRDAFVNDVLFGYGRPAKSVLIGADATFINTNPDEQVQYNPELAQQLAGEALGGERKNVVLLFNPPGEALHGWPYPTIAAYLQAILSPLGLDIELRQLEAAAVTEAREKGEYDMVLGANCWATGDPDYILSRLLDSQSTINATQSGGYNNPEVDALLDQARVTTNLDEQVAIYQQIQAIGNRDVPVAPLFDQENIIAGTNRVKGLAERIAYAPTLETVYIVERD
jgi:peptide/nickel transport system substrate-binding protein